MSGYTMTQAEVLYSGPPSAFPAAGASSTATVSAMVGASGDYSQPYFPGGFWQQGRQNQLATFKFAATVSAQASATTLTVGLVADTSPQSISSDVTLVTSSAITVTSYSGGTVWGEGIIQSPGQGYGSASTVAGSTLSSINVIGAGNALSVSGAGGPTLATTMDFSVNQWLTLVVAFSTNSGTNTFTLKQFVLYGDN